MTVCSERLRVKPSTLPNSHIVASSTHSCIITIFGSVCTALQTLICLHFWIRSIQCGQTQFITHVDSLNGCLCPSPIFLMAIGDAHHLALYSRSSNGSLCRVESRALASLTSFPSVPLLPSSSPFQTLWVFRVLPASGPWDVHLLFSIVI